jgi:hypothetical protein
VGKKLIVRESVEQPADTKRVTPDTPMILDRIMTVNLSRAAHLPNFIADEVVECYNSSTNPPDWPHSTSARFDVAI